MLKATKTTNLNAQKEVNTFIAPNNNDSIYGNNPSQLLVNENMEYISNNGNIGLGVRRGNQLQKDLNSGFVSLSGAGTTTDCYWGAVVPPGYTPVVYDDTELKTGLPGTLPVEYYSAIKWDVTSIPAGAIITKANIKLTVKSFTSNGQITDYFLPFVNTSAFTVADGGKPTFNAPLLLEENSTDGAVIITASTTEVNLVVPVNVINNWISVNNFGIYLYSYATDLTFYSSTDGTAGNRPTLEVYYYLKPIGGGLFNYNYSTPRYVWLEGDYDNDNDGNLKILSDGLAQTINTYTVQSATHNAGFKWTSGVSNIITTPTVTSFSVKGGFDGGSNIENAPTYLDNSSFYCCKFSTVALASDASIKSVKLRIYIGANAQQLLSIYSCASDFTVDKGTNYIKQPLGKEFLAWLNPNKGAGYYDITLPSNIINSWVDNPSSNYGIIIGYRPIWFLTDSVFINTYSDINPPQLVVTTEAYSATTISTLKTSMTDNEPTSFVPYGIGTASVLYGANIDDGIFKVTGSPAAHSVVSSVIKPSWLSYSDISGRLVAVKDHNVYYSRVNVNPLNTTNLETFTGEFAEIFEIDTVYSTGISSTFVVGETITGSASSKTAVIVYIGENSKTLYLNTLSGAFTANELLTGGTSGTTAIYRRSTYVDGSNKNLQYATISPDQGKGFTCCIDNAQTMFLFKDTGIWALPNAGDDPLVWRFPKCDANIGTLSPKSVQLVNYGQSQGIIYLGSDKTLRFFTAQVDNNSGTRPTLTSSASVSISMCFQNILDTINETYLNRVTASYFNKYYILCIPSTGSDLNRTIIIDTEKLRTISGSDTPQPYWFEATNFNYPVMLINPINNNLYGIENNLFLNRLLVPNYFVDDIPQRLNYGGNSYYSIPYKAYSIFSKLSDYEAELYKVDVNFYSEHNSYLGINSVRQGEVLPPYRTLFDKSLNYNTTDFTTFTSLNIHKRGHYFNFGVNKLDATNNFKLYGINMFFKGTRRHQLTKNY